MIQRHKSEEVQIISHTSRASTSWTNKLKMATKTVCPHAKEDHGGILGVLLNVSVKAFTSIWSWLVEAQLHDCLVFVFTQTFHSPWNALRWAYGKPLQLRYLSLHGFPSLWSLKSEKEEKTWDPPVSVPVTVPHFSPDGFLYAQSVLTPSLNCWLFDCPYKYHLLEKKILTEN